jgi:hypothetical protein
MKKRATFEMCCSECDCNIHYIIRSYKVNSETVLVLECAECGETCEII